MKKRNPLPLLGGVGLGAGLMYLLDPDGGRRRRALARDKAVHGLKVSGKALRKTSADLGNRTRGLVAEAGSRLRKVSADDRKLEGRVRSKLGRHLSHPSALQVQCQDGLVILSGPVLASELDKVLAKVQKIKGVQDVESRLEVHESAECRTWRAAWRSTRARRTCRRSRARTAAGSSPRVRRPWVSEASALSPASASWRAARAAT
jgi:hypothetical protein